MDDRYVCVHNAVSADCLHESPTCFAPVSSSLWTLVVIHESASAITLNTTSTPISRTCREHQDHGQKTFECYCYSIRLAEVRSGSQTPSVCAYQAESVVSAPASCPLASRTAGRRTRQSCAPRGPWTTQQRPRSMPFWITVVVHRGSERSVLVLRYTYCSQLSKL